MKVSVVHQKSVLDNAKIICNQGNVTEAIDMDYLYKWTPSIPVFISAQTGSGKNTFVRETLIRNLVNLGFNFLIMSNRIALSRQEKRNIAIIMDEICPSKSKYSYEEELDRHSPQMLDEFENIGNITIKSYQSFLSRKENLKGYDFIIFDECHFFLADAIFNKSTYNILTDILKMYPFAIRIYMSATPEDVIVPIITTEQKIIDEEKLKNKNTAYNQSSIFHPIIFRFLPNHDSNRIWNYEYTQYTLFNHYAVKGLSKGKPIKTEQKITSFSTFMVQAEEMIYEIDTYEAFNSFSNSAVIYKLDRNYDYINCKYLSIDESNLSKEEDSTINKLYQPIIDLVKKQITAEENNKKIEKWMIFVGKKVDGQKLLDLIGSQYASYIDSKSKYSTKEDGLIYNNICEKGIFDKKVLITTSVLDNGVSIVDPQVKHIAILKFDKVSFLQMLGRKRVDKNQKLMLYIQEFASNSLNGILKKFKDALDKIKASNINNHEEIIKNIINNDEIFYFNNKKNLNLDGILGYNYFLENKLENDINFLENILYITEDSIESFGKKTIIEQLSWINKVNSFDISNYLNTFEEKEIEKANNREKLFEFLESKCCKEEISKDSIKRKDFFRVAGMNQSQQKDFCIKFSELYNNTYIAKKIIKVYGKKIISDFLREKGLQYEIVTETVKINANEKEKNNERKNSTTLWILIKADK